MQAWLIRIAALAALCFGAAGAVAQDKVRFSLNPQIYSYLPVFIAVDKGYFKEQNIELDIATYPGSALSQIPMLARGDQDLAGMVTGPAFFNQHAEGFGIKLVASLAQSKPGWHDTMWIMIRKDMWDSGKIKTFADLKGMAIEGGPKGSPVYLLSRQAMEQGGPDPRRRDVLGSPARRDGFAAAVPKQGDRRHVHGRTDREPLGDRGTCRALEAGARSHSLVPGGLHCRLAQISRPRSATSPSASSKRF